MLGFFNTKISTLAGIIILLVIGFGVGFAIYHQFNQIVDIQMSAIERQLGE